jgi:hypothetical protein
VVEPPGTALLRRDAFAPGLCMEVALAVRRGRRECRVMTSPMARLQQKTQAAVTTGSAGSTGIPCATVYGLFRDLLGDRA